MISLMWDIKQKATNEQQNTKIQTTDQKWGGRRMNRVKVTGGD